MKFKEGKQRDLKAGHAFKQNPELNVNSLQREKYKDTGLCFAVPLHKGFSTFIHPLPKRGRHLGSYQRKAGTIKLTVFEERLHLHLREYLSLSGLLR